jgi:hypothetical protein
MYNLHAEVVTIDATHKVQEWFIPWTSFGNGGFPFGTSLNGRRLGFAAGYNDKDGDNALEDKLRFTGKDPWSTSVADAWGDLLIAADMPGPPCPTGYDSCSAARPVTATGVTASRVVATDYYDLSGSRIAPEVVRQLPANSVCIKVLRFADGHRVNEVSRLAK